MTDEAALWASVADNPMDGTPLKIFADWQDENGRPRLAMFMRMGIIGPRGDGYGYGGYGGDGYGGDGYGGDGDGYGYGGYGGDGYGGDGDGYGYGYGGGSFKRFISEGLKMNDGLAIITVASGYSPFVLIGWAKRGDLFVDMHGCRVVRRYGSRAQLAVIAEKGPQADTELLAASPVESIGIAMIGRVIPCDEAAWKKECPKPKGWDA